MRLIPTLIVVLLTPWLMRAQEDLPADSIPVPAGRAILDLVFEVEPGFPVGDFRSDIAKEVMVGKGIGIFYRFKKMPVDVGLRFGDFSYDHVRRKFDSDQYVQKTKNKIWVWYGAVRVEPPLELPFQPYVEGSVGWRRFFTKTYSKEAGILPFIFGDEEEENRFDEAVLHSDWGLVFGGAVGAKIVLGRDSRLDVQLGFRQSTPGNFYIHNGAATVETDPLDNYIERHAALSMLSFKAGLSLLLRPMRASGETDYR